MKTLKSALLTLSAFAALFAANLSRAADAVVAAAPAANPPLNWHAIVMFVIFVAITLVITYWAATRTKTASDFYAAGRGITGFQNGMAIAGDYMSAASFLGIAALVYMNGFYGASCKIAERNGFSGSNLTQRQDFSLFKRHFALYPSEIIDSAPLCP